MARQIERKVTIIRGISAASLAVLVILCANILGAAAAFADRDSPQFHRGACEGSYPGWLRGVVDGYHDLSLSSVKDPSSVLQMVPTPEELTSADERLGYGEGLKEGFKLGVSYGVELGRAARTAESDAETMGQMTARFQAFVQEHCGDLIAALDWKKTFMNTAETSTVATLNEAQLAMHLAATANQLAISAEEMARGAQEAEAKGDLPAALKFRATAQSSAQMSASFAQMARSHAAAGREEAVQAIIDAEAAAERAKKAVDGAGG
ncbi:hypothetical protein DFR48_10790 [Ciceribacter lividus]|uniref:Uncharacterized protein n=1 Tax=Ciceribacter lividus TaxID=1197950 RepID=A0A6I7HME6_9HYPH|nr:hypothetical protein [Ciceribacter lividus]RCW23221.1 hypothetical protein DFR48_10790 [Ciceribacter lividus]